MRGLIVSALRDAPRGATPAALRRIVASPKVGPLIDALVAEGLLERTGGRVRLPG